MVAQIQGSVAQSRTLNEISPTEQAALIQQPTADDSDVFDWKKIESLRFVVQVGFSLLVVGFCIGKLSGLSTNPDSDKAIYWGGLTSIVAWWMPTPGTKGTMQPHK